MVSVTALSFMSGQPDNAPDISPVSGVNEPSLGTGKIPSPFAAAAVSERSLVSYFTHWPSLAAGDTDPTHVPDASGEPPNS